MQQHGSFGRPPSNYGAHPGHAPPGYGGPTPQSVPPQQYGQGQTIHAQPGYPGGHAMPGHSTFPNQTLPQFGHAPALPGEDLKLMQGNKKGKVGDGKGLLNAFERFTGIDWNGDGAVGGVGQAPKPFDWQEYERIHGVDLDGDGKIGGRAMTQDDLQGVGIRLQQGARGESFISEIVPDGPAAVEGTLKVGDRIMTVDRMDTESEHVDEVVKLIRGPKGTVCEIVAKQGHMQVMVLIQRGVVTHPQKLYALMDENITKLMPSQEPYQENYLNPNVRPYSVPGNPSTAYAQDGRMPSASRSQMQPLQMQPPQMQTHYRQQPPHHAEWGHGHHGHGHDYGQSHSYGHGGHGQPMPGSVPSDGQVSYVWDRPQQARNYSGQPFPNPYSIPPLSQGTHAA